MTTVLHKSRIVVSHEYPPIPTRRYDYMATREDYDIGDPIGTGPTEDAAIAELIEQEEARQS